MALISLGGKWGYYGLAEWEPEARIESRLVTFLEEQGWSPLGRYELMSGHGLLAFAAPSCERGVAVTVVAPNGELFAVLRAAAGPDHRLLFIERGSVRENPSRVGYLRTRLRSAAAQLGIGAKDTAILVAILEPSECDATARIPWSKLQQS